MQTEYVLQYKWNRKWTDLAWKGKSKEDAINECAARTRLYNHVYRVVERKTTETVIK